MQNKSLLKNGLSVLLMFIMIQTTFGQKNYQAASLIRNEGDTLHGAIDYVKWQYNRNALYFKEGNSMNINIYTPSDLKGYLMQGDVYISAMVDTELSPDIEKQLTYEPEVVIVKEHVFLKVLISGDKSLYSYKNSINKFQFYILQDTVITLLIHKKYKKKQPDKTRQGYYSTFILHNKTYIGQLSLYLNDCMKLESKIKRAEYSENSIKSLFMDYMKYKGLNIEFENKRKKTSVHFGVTAGATSVRLDFEPVPLPFYITEASTFLIDPDFKRSNDIAAGVFMDLVFPWDLHRWSLSNEILYNSFVSSTGHEIYVHDNDYTQYYITVGHSSIKFSSMIRYQYPIGKFSPFVNVGLSKNIFYNSMDELEVVSKFWNDESTKTVQEYYSHEKLGLLAGIGVKYKHFNVQYRYEGFRSQAVFGNENYLFKRNRQYLLIGYTF